NRQRARVRARAPPVAASRPASAPAVPECGPRSRRDVVPCDVCATGGGEVRCVVVTKGNSKSIRATLELFDVNGGEAGLEDNSREDAMPNKVSVARWLPVVVLALSVPASAVSPVRRFGAAAGG